MPKAETEETIDVYAGFTKTKINPRAREQLWHLTVGDPLYIKALFLSLFNTEKDYTREENIVEVYEKEISEGEIYATWTEYMLNALIAGDLIFQGSSAYRYEITKDKTYELVFKGVYQDEINHFVSDIKGEIRKALEYENYLKGKFA